MYDPLYVDEIKIEKKKEKGGEDSSRSLEETNHFSLN